jgi:hypothetical protein
MPATYSLGLGAAFLLLVACGGDDSDTTSLTGGTGGTTTTSSAGTGGTPCQGTEIVCGGACVDTATSAEHCGTCDFACQGAETCCQGACSTACTLTITSVTPALGPLSGGTYLTVKGEGFGSGARVHLGTSRAPARVVDATTLLVVTPPGLAAKVDLRVDQGADHATRGAAFRYAPYGLQGDWQKIDMSSPRGNWPGIAVLQDGRVLISGGVSTSSGNSVEDTADLYDPATNLAGATAGNMSAPRWTQASVTLLTGNVLVLGTWFGGYSPPNGPLADLFDPATTTFTATANKPSVEHRWPHAVLLADGRALVVSYTVGTVEIYDPASDSFSLVASAPDCTGYRPTRLLDGRIALVKGAGATVHLFDSDTGTFTDAGAGPTALDGDLYTLPDGRVMYVAGSIMGPTSMTPTDVLELFDPAASGFQPASYHLVEARERTLTTAMAGDGTVLVLGGEVGDQVLNPACAVNTFVLTDGVELIDPVAGQVTAFAALPEKNFVMSAATTLDGSVVAAGGAPCGGAEAYPYFYFLKGEPPVPE